MSAARRPSGSRPGTSGRRSDQASRSRPPGGGTSIAAAWSGSRDHRRARRGRRRPPGGRRVFTAEGRLLDQPAELARLTGIERPLCGRPRVRARRARDRPGDRIGPVGQRPAQPRSASRRSRTACPSARTTRRSNPPTAAGRSRASHSPDAPYGTREPRCVVGGRVAVDDEPSPRPERAPRLRRARATPAPGRRHGRLPLAGSEPVVVAGDFNAAIEAPELAGGGRARSTTRSRPSGSCRATRAAVVGAERDRPRPEPRPRCRGLPGRDRGRRRVGPPAGGRDLRAAPDRLTRAVSRASRSRSRSTWSASSASRARAPSTTAGGALATNASFASRARAAAEPAFGLAQLALQPRRSSGGRAGRRRAAGRTTASRSPPGTMTARSPGARPPHASASGVRHAMQRPGPGQSLDRRPQRLERRPRAPTGTYTHVSSRSPAGSCAVARAFRIARPVR